MPTRAGIQRTWVKAQNVKLLLEGYELLYDSPFVAVRDGDLISVKMKLPSHGVGAEGVPMDLDVEAEGAFFISLVLCFY